MTNSTLNVVVITDLDGTLLDRASYSYAPAMLALELLRQKKIPLVFCSAKTRAEQEVYRSEMGISGPFIVENGGAIFVLQGYFPLSLEYHKTIDEYLVIELGIPYYEVRATLERITSDLGVDFKGFGDMSAEEVAAETGLDLEAAWHAITISPTPLPLVLPMMARAVLPVSLPPLASGIPFLLSWREEI